MPLNILYLVRDDERNANDASYPAVTVSPDVRLDYMFLPISKPHHAVPIATTRAIEPYARKQQSPTSPNNHNLSFAGTRIWSAKFKMGG